MKRDFAEQYEDLESWHWWFVGRLSILQDVLERRLPADRERRSIISVGSGPPKGLTWLGRFAGAGGLVVALDADPSGALRTQVPAQRRESGAAQEAAFVLGAIERPPIRPGAADVVLALDVLEHLDDDVAGLAAASRMVKPGGLLLVTVPALPSLWGNQDVVSEHRRRYTAATLKDLFARAGLPAPELTYFNSLLFPAVAAVRWGRRWMGRAEHAKSDFAGARPGLANTVLTNLFSAERHLLRRTRLPVGVSLMAVLQAPS